MEFIIEILSPYEGQVGNDYHSYLNHAERVFQIARNLDSTNAFHPDKFAIACAFHDLGIWTNDTWDYLRPSEKLCKEYLEKVGRSEWEGEIMLMINQHHKLLPYKGRFQNSVELFRKADLVDFSSGVIRFSVPKKKYKELVDAYPLHGFHGVLFRQFWKHFRQNPWSPFPMVKV